MRHDSWVFFLACNLATPWLSHESKAKVAIVVAIVKSFPKVCRMPLAQEEIGAILDF